MEVCSGGKRVIRRGMRTQPVWRRKPPPRFEPVVWCDRLWRQRMTNAVGVRQTRVKLRASFPHQPGQPVPRERPKIVRSEEHTSELQSRLHLVCRLLLEKKKNLATHVQSDPTL